MANPAWSASGDYFETCTCDYLCPCLSSNLAAPPTKGECVFAFAFRVDRGRFGGVSLDGLCFALAGVAPGAMGEGNWKVGLIVDERVDAAQEQALAAIASGQAGGPMAALRPLITSFLGVEKASIRFEKDGLRRSVSIPGVLDQAVEGVPSPTVPGEPLVIDNSIHPVNRRVVLARAIRSVLSVFDLRMNDVSGRNNGHFAPFSWQSAAATWAGSLLGLRPQVLTTSGPMARGGGTLAAYVDARGNDTHGAALEAIFTGNESGPSSLLMAMVTHRLTTKTAWINFSRD